jgi:hypothetical protein
MPVPRWWYRLLNNNYETAYESRMCIHQKYALKTFCKEEEEVSQKDGILCTSEKQSTTERPFIINVGALHYCCLNEMVKKFTY